MDTPAGCIVIVDGYSTGRELVRELLDRNVECLHLRSTPALPAPVAKCFDPSPYDADLGYLGGLEDAVATLTTIAPDAVVAGSEFGVTFAERIAHRMGLPTNRPDPTGARRDKFAMIERIRGAGLAAAAQCEAHSLDEARAFAVAHGAWPIIVKPMDSAGSDGLAICRNMAELEAGFVRIHHRENFMGSVNDRVLLQSYLAGLQFIVNTISRDGCHRVSDAWHMAITTLPGSAITMNELVLLDPATPEARTMFAYIRRVLDALGIQNGAAHSELKWTPAGPVLIETGARLMGAAMDAPSYEAAGAVSQARQYATALAGCRAERDALFADSTYTLARHMTKLFFVFDAPGEVRGTAGLARLRNLPSFHAHYRPLKRGDIVWKTADTLACGGAVYLVHDDPHQVAADIATFRAWEKLGLLYDVAPSMSRSAAALADAENVR